MRKQPEDRRKEWIGKPTPIGSFIDNDMNNMKYMLKELEEEFRILDEEYHDKINDNS